MFRLHHHILILLLSLNLIVFGSAQAAVGSCAADCISCTIEAEVVSCCASKLEPKSCCDVPKPQHESAVKTYDNCGIPAQDHKTDCDHGVFCPGGNSDSATPLTVSFPVLDFSTVEKTHFVGAIVSGNRPGKLFTRQDRLLYPTPSIYTLVCSFII